MVAPSSDSDPTLVSLLGATDNLNDPKPGWNHQGTILGIILTSMIISILCILFRLYTRLFILKCPGWDDFLVLCFMISGATGSIFICILTGYGLGQHFILLKEEVMSDYLMMFYVANATYCMSTTLIKLSLLFQYLRIFKRGSMMRGFTIGMAVLITLWGLAFSFIAWFPCFPVSGYWNLTSQAATCYGYGSRHVHGFVTTYECHSAFNVVFDLVVLSIPLPLYFKSATPDQTRKGLVGLSVMGVLINLFGIWRLVTIVEHQATTYPTFDPTWYASDSFVMACLEIDAASICASVPVFWPVISAKFEEIFVTKEIIITRSHRRLSEDHEGLESEEYGDTVELQQNRSGSAATTLQLSRSRSRSDNTLDEVLHAGAGSGKTQNHYADKYIVEQIDPLRTDRKMGVESAVTVGQAPEADLTRKPSKTLTNHGL